MVRRGDHGWLGCRPVVISLFLALIWFVDYSFDRDFGDGVGHWPIIAAAAIPVGVALRASAPRSRDGHDEGPDVGKLAIRERGWSSGIVMHRLVAIMAPLWRKGCPGRDGAHGADLTWHPSSLGGAHSHEGPGPYQKR